MDWGNTKFMADSGTYQAQPLGLPHCWQVGDTITSIVITYDGVSLIGATVELIFSNGQTLVPTITFEPTVEFPDRYVISFAAFQPLAPISGDYVTYQMPVLYGPAAAPMVKRTIHAGKWHLKTLA